MRPFYASNQRTTESRYVAQGYRLPVIFIQGNRRIEDTTASLNHVVSLFQAKVVRLTSIEDLKSLLPSFSRAQSYSLLAEISYEISRRTSNKRKNRIESRKIWDHVEGDRRALGRRLDLA
jgi:hypothetical protein